MSLQCRLKFILYISIVFIYLYNNPVQTANTKTKAYLIENTKFLTWPAAVEYCKNMNMSLFRIENFVEFDYLKGIVKTKYGVVYPYWLGAHKVNGVFKWIATGSTVRLFLWHAGEPDNSSGNEKCIQTWAEDFDWNDNDCERELPFICELE